MSIPKAALDLIIGFEGYLKRLPDDTAAPYLCPAGVATIGYGSTRYFRQAGDTAVPQGRVRLGDPPITRARATECLAGELLSNEQAFDRLTTAKVHPLMRGAIVSFIYNCGEGAYRASGVRRVVNSGQWDKVPRELAKWRMGGGRILRGLVRRRAAEAALFMEGARRLQSEGIGHPSAPPPIPTPPISAPRPIQEAPAGWWRTVVAWIFK